MKLSATGNDSENGGYNFWDFLKNWPNLTDEDKLTKYDLYCCHEVNIFLKFQHPDFFNKVVKPFIANKLAKTFVDDFLLDNFEKCSSYSSTIKMA